MKKLTLLLALVLVLTFIPTTVLADSYSATIKFTNGTATEDKTITFTDPEDVIGLQDFAESIGGMSPKYFMGWVKIADPLHPYDIYNPDQPLFFGNEKISDIFPNGNTEAVTFRTLYVNAGDFKNEKNKYELNKGMSGNDTVPNASIQSVERDINGKLTKINVYYDENFGNYPLSINGNLTVDKYISLFGYHNPNNILEVRPDTAEYYMSPSDNVPLTYLDYNLIIDGRIILPDEMSMAIRSYVFRPYNAIGDTGEINDNGDSIRIGYQVTDFGIDSSNPGNPENILKFNRAMQLDENASEESENAYIPVTKNTNHLVIRNKIKNDGHTSDNSWDATPAQIFEDSVLYFINPRSLSVPNSLARDIADGKENPIKISSFMKGYYNTGYGNDIMGQDEFNDKLWAQDLIINFVRRIVKPPVIPDIPTTDVPKPEPTKQPPVIDLSPIFYDYGHGVTTVENRESHYPYIKGYPDGSVQPEGYITRGETAAIFARLMGIVEGNNYQENYPDVNPTDWYANYIGFLSDKNVIKGYPDGSFKPEERITRAEYATIASAFTDKIGSTSFPDIENHWAKLYISKVTEEGWIKGYPDGTYKPDQHITRAEAVKITNPIFKRFPDMEFISKNPAMLITFTDLINSHWAYYELMEAAQGHEFIRVEKEMENWRSLF